MVLSQARRHDGRTRAIEGSSRALLVNVTALPRVLLGTRVLSDDTCRNSEDEGPIWNVLCDDRSRADDGAMTNLHVRQDERTHSDIGLILDATCAGDVGSRVYADAITERRVVTDKGAPIEEHVAADSRVSGHNHSSADDRALT